MVTIATDITLALGNIEAETCRLTADVGVDNINGRIDIRIVSLKLDGENVRLPSSVIEKPVLDAVRRYIFERPFVAWAEDTE